MIRKLVTFSLPVLALIGGTFAGDIMRTSGVSGTDPASAQDDGEIAQDQADATAPSTGSGQDGADAALGDAGWFTFPTQFFVPLVRQGDMREMMILTLTLQTDAASIEALGHKEHALRDALLRALMIHANTGGFDGNYTADRNLEQLRSSLLKAGQAVTELPISAVLIEDIALQPG